MNQQELRNLLMSSFVMTYYGYYDNPGIHLKNYRFKIKNGKDTIELWTYVWDIQNGIPIYDVGLSIQRKRSNVPFHSELVTGEGYIKSLVFAKQLVLELPYFLFAQNGELDKLILQISGIDRRRASVYKRSFEKHGFKNPYSTNSRIIVKLFERKNITDLQ